MPAGLTDTIVEWESKEFLKEKIMSPIIANHNLSPKRRWINNLRIWVRFKGSCLKQDKVIFTLRNVVNLFISKELDRWSEDLHADFTLRDCLEVLS